MLGIIDWGIGGISVYKLVKQRLDVPVVYFSDTGVTPYGKMARGELTSRLDAVIEYLKTRCMTHLVIGCNAASTSIPFLKNHEIPVEGVIAVAVEESAAQKPTRLAVIGGRRTVVSGVYRRAFAAKGIEIEQRIAQPLSGLIESGDVGSDRLVAEARKILAPIRSTSHILLACTHYPAITPVLQKIVSPKTQFIDPAGALVKKIAGWNLPREGEDIFITSGDPEAMKRAAKLAFGVDIDSVIRQQPARK